MESNDTSSEVEDTGTDVMSKYVTSSPEENLSEASPVSSVFVRVDDSEPSVTAEQFPSLQQDRQLEPVWTKTNLSITLRGASHPARHASPVF